MGAVYTFRSALGPLEIAYGDAAITGVRLLERPPRGNKRQTPPPFVREAARAIEEHLGSGARPLDHLPIDLGGLPAFHRRVYEVARSIPPGKTVSYGELAERLGSPGAARAIGQAMARNPFMLVVPCHRVLGSSGLGGFSAPGGDATKKRLLELEGAFLQNTPFDHERAIRELRAADAEIAALIDRTGDRRLRVEPVGDVFEALGRAIIYQQLSGKAAGAIHRKYAALFSGGRPTARDLARVSDRKVRSAGVSSAKLLALRDLARKVTEGEVPSLAKLESMNDDAIVESLTRVRGIGPWTVHMLLIFRLGRPDVLPVGDYGVRKAFAKVYKKRKLPDARTLERHAERWRPWRSVASWYLWRALE